jgi:uncharacterized membrane protein YbhN (UPF0104 family)
MIKKLFVVLFYLSFIFLGIYLYQINYLKIPRVINYHYFIMSIVLLLFGFYWQNLNWKKSLSVFKIEVSIADAIISSGLSIFMKYIPGKVMVVLGRAAWISQKYDFPLITTSSASLFTQLLTLWVGLAMGSVLLLSAEISNEWKLLSISTFLALTIALLFPGLIEKGFNYFFRFFKKRISIPNISYKKALMLFPSFAITWLFWGFGFYFLVLALYEEVLPISLAMAFPLSGTLAIVALFAPGGLGIREGLLVSCLLIFNIPLVEATSIALASRLWFLIGEVSLFLASVVLSKNKYS